MGSPEKIHRITSSSVVPATAQWAYSIIADYHNGHPRILPKPYFTNLQVEQGGVGAGTVIRFQMRVLGKTRTVHGVVTEPEPGRVLTETYAADDTVTSFTIDPLGDQQSRVTITTLLKTHAGLLGAVERWFATRLLHRIYERELNLLISLAAGNL